MFHTKDVFIEERLDKEIRGKEIAVLKHLYNALKLLNRAYDNTAKIRFEMIEEVQEELEKAHNESDSVFDSVRNAEKHLARIRPDVPNKGTIAAQYAHALADEKQLLLNAYQSKSKRYAER